MTSQNSQGYYFLRAAELGAPPPPRANTTYISLLLLGIRDMLYFTTVGKFIHRILLNDTHHIPSRLVLMRNSTVVTGLISGRSLIHLAARVSYIADRIWGVRRGM